ncbi:hypothetical protein D9611_003274 [Ephemerocybe angulata]|uniref:BZIP domain-containing protein n=1 Tax=Ephemerocybe angulata TaxID=980116 RepID=A0A8H5C9T2_9AGAR|nr:hypothetical protein D9611_003274 [Tulosesus angulatus]
MSSTKLWATASKEWVIPSKPKPGRKPKKDVVVEDAAEDDAKGRRIQNRAAQRAFRERKQSQLAELQARILSYEQGEIERNVALQKIAKRLKEENDKLVQENAALKEKVAKLELEQQQREKSLAGSDANEKKRWRDDSPPSRTARKRSRTSATPPTTVDTASQSSSSPASTMVSTPEATGVDSPHISPPVYDLSSDMEQSGFNDMLDFASSMKVVNIDPTSFPQFNCGFCSDDTPCVCRDLALNQLNESLVGFKDTGYDHPSPLSVEFPTQQAPPNPAPSSILENLPAYQPPVPLRRKGKSSSKSIFPLIPLTESRVASTSAAATCSGDPSNCAACSDDDFGKAFCSAIEETVNNRAACDGCPTPSLDGPTEYARTGLSTNSGCCGSLMGCGGCPSTSISAATVIEYEQEEPQNYIPTNDAWRRIKEHPNAQFADLSLLAEVVASRSKCTGPRIVITPPPDHFNNNRQQDQVLPSFGNPVRVKQEVPRLVPQEILLECGRRRVREVHSDAVRDALRMLDAKFT